MTGVDPGTGRSTAYGYTIPGGLTQYHLIGPEVTELLPELTLAQQWDLTVHEVARNVHAHPTLGDVDAFVMYQAL